MNVFRVLLWPLRNYQRSVSDAPAPPPAPELSLAQYENLAPTQMVRDSGTEVVYATPNLFTKWRVNSLFTTEPDTIEQIGGFQPGEVLSTSALTSAYIRSGRPRRAVYAHSRLNPIRKTTHRIAAIS
jgi:hypothetical protein